VADQRKARTGARSNSGPGSAHGGRRVSSGRAGRPRISWAVIIWLAFAIFIFGLFLFSREAIFTSVQTIRNEFAARDLPPLPPPEEVTGPQGLIPVVPPPSIVVVQPPPAQPITQEPVIVPPTPQEEPPSQVAVTGQVPAMPQGIPVEPAPLELRPRALYFTQVDRSGAILRVQVDRNLPLTPSPLTDVVHALIAGPTEAERQRGLITLIPPGTRMLSAAVRGSTAYISFNDDFQFNTFGVEGYIAQLRQLVFTVTEFPNVRDVQILIEGRRLEFMGEGIWIGSPLSRDMF